MTPVQELFEGKLTVIRPLFMVDESRIRKFAAFMNWPTIELGCPTSGMSKREAVKDMLNDFYRTNKKIKGNIFHALHNVNADYLL